ncbi:MAG TPA: helix-turn-helix transcriptional regulator [Desulfuromonadaceae bacterium]
MAKGGGSGKTPERVVELLKKAVAEKGQSAVARESGLTQSAVHRYLSGIGEPSTSTLDKLASYFKVQRLWLTGDDEYLEYLERQGRYHDEWEKEEREQMEAVHDKYRSIVEEFREKIPFEEWKSVFDLLYFLADLDIEPTGEKIKWGKTLKN